MTVRPIGDLRRHVACISNAAVTVLVVVQEAFDDLEGGVAARQWGLVAAQSRLLVQACLHVRGLAGGSEAYFWEDTAAGDPFEHVTEEEIAEAYVLLHEACALPDGDPLAWLERMRAYVRATEDTLRLTDRLPELRSPDGMFGGLRLVRDWQPLGAELGLPPLLPGEWTAPL